MAAVNQPQPNR